MITGNTEGKKRRWFFIKICFLLIIVVVFVIANLIIKRECIFIENSFEFCFEISKDCVDGNIRGWVGCEDNDKQLRENCPLLVLVDESTDDCIFLDTEIIDSENAYFANIGADRYSMFEGKTDNKSISTTTRYQIAIRVNARNRDTIMTDYYFQNGQIIKGSELDLAYISFLNAISGNNQGCVLGVLASAGLMVYQMDNKLMIITDENYDFKTDGRTLIQYQIWPWEQCSGNSDVILNGISFENSGFIYEEHEITSADERYRVAEVLLPTSYPIWKCRIGETNDNAWSWELVFRPSYELLQK